MPGPWEPKIIYYALLEVVAMLIIEAEVRVWLLLCIVARPLAQAHAVRRNAWRG